MYASFYYGKINSYFKQLYYKTMNNLRQKVFFDYIKRSIGNRLNLAYDIAFLLGISLDAAYRRIRGATELTFSELDKISTHYKVSIDKIFNIKSNEISFSYNPLASDFRKNYLIYLTQLRDHLSNLVTQESGKIYFSAIDIPLFHLCKYYSLKSFKTYTLHQQYKNDLSKYNPENFYDKEYHRLYDEIYCLYSKIESFEIWTTKTLSTYTKLIKYYAEIDCFEDINDAKDLCNDLLKMIEDIRKIGESRSSQSDKEKTHLYLSEIELDNKFIYVSSTHYKSTFINLYSLNAIRTDNESLCLSVERWFNYIISKSTLISGVSQKKFHLFLKNLEEEVKSIKILT